MSDPTRELRLEEIPEPPLFKLIDDGADVFQHTEVGGEMANVAALFSSPELAEEFTEGAEALGMETLATFVAEELEDRFSAEEYASSGMGYLLVVTERGTGLFHASDVAARFSDGSGGDFPFPLHFFTDEAGESPLISVEEGEGEILLLLVLFSSSEEAEAFKEKVSHLDLPDTLGTIRDREGLRRHALVAERAGADYAVIDPESSTTEAMPIDELK